MAITQRAIGAWAVSNATTQTVTLPTHAAGDMLIVRTIRKPFTSPNNTVINTSGWAAVATGVANGATANGVGVGSMGFKAFYKIAASSAETNPVVTWGTTSAPGACVAAAYQKAAADSWVTPVGNGGGDATARTSQTSTIASHISVTAGDLVDFFRGAADDSGALTVPTITQTGVTYNTVTESPATAIADGTSNDIAADGGYRTATAGTSSAAAVVTGTSSASEEHGAWMTRLRVNQGVSLPFIGADSWVTTITAAAPVAWWRLGEPSGTNANDEIGTLDGTYVNTPTLAQTSLITGDSNTAVDFDDGTTQHMRVPDNSVIDLGDGPFSFEVLFTLANPASGANRYLTAKGTTALTVIAIGSAGATKIQADTYANQNCIRSSVSISDTARHHLVVTKAAGDTGSGIWKMYIDGADVTTDINTTSLGAVSTATDLFIGSTHVPDSGFDGIIDEPMFYNRVLSAVEAEAHYSAATAGGTGAAVLYAPGLAQVAGGPSPQTLTMPQLDAAPALYAPVVIIDQFVTLGLIDAAATLYAPTVIRDQFLTAPFLDAASALYAPTVIIDQFVTLGLLDAAPAPYAPTLAQTGAATGQAVWTTPADTVAITSLPVLTFTMPSAAAPMHFEMQIDDNSGFSSPDSFVSQVSQTGWEYWNGSAWTAVPSGGVNQSFAGNEARYTVQTPLSGTIYRRVRAGV